MHEAIETRVEPVSIGDLPDQPRAIIPEPVPLPPPPNTVTVRKGTEVQQVELPQ